MTLHRLGLFEKLEKGLKTTDSIELHDAHDPFTIYDLLRYLFLVHVKNIGAETEMIFKDGYNKAYWWLGLFGFPLILQL